MVGSYKFHIGQTVRFIEHKNICRAASKDVGKIAKIKSIDFSNVHLFFKDGCHSYNGESWLCPIEAIVPVSSQMMMFEL